MYSSAGVTFYYHSSDVCLFGSVYINYWSIIYRHLIVKVEMNFECYLKMVNTY